MLLKRQGERLALPGVDIERIPVTLQRFAIDMHRSNAKIDALLELPLRSCAAIRAKRRRPHRPMFRVHAMHYTTDSAIFRLVRIKGY